MSHGKRVVFTPQLVLVTGAALWSMAVFAAPLLQIDALYTFFSAVCHQDPSRSWFLGGQPLAVCVRCTSIYVGFFLALVARLPASQRLLRVAVASIFIEFLVARLGLDFELTRAATGLLLGLSTARFVEMGVSELFSHRIRLASGAGE